ncbi:DMT family transporter [Stappia sp.]|uniref:DMT family transporter n=1 Tax=Stappia sp. TaxID=1870903 RepID=UPI0026010631|nr:DMT family transporter [Stappia sp.]
MSSSPTSGVSSGENGRAILFMLAAMAGFIFNDSLTKLTADHLPLGQIMFLRGLMAISLLLVLCFLDGSIRKLGLVFNPLIGLRVLAEVLGALFYLKALFNMPLANATAIMQVQPLAITAGAALFLGAPVGWRRWSAIAVGFGGVLLIVRPGMAGFDAWSLWALAAVVCVVSRDLLTSRTPRNIPTYIITLASLSGVAAAGAGLSSVETWVTPRAGDMAALAAAACFILVGFVSIISAMRTGDISLVAPFRYSIILWAILIGYLVWGDVPDGQTLIGIGILVVTGLYSLMRERKLLRKPGPAAKATPLR